MPVVRVNPNHSPSKRSQTAVGQQQAQAVFQVLVGRTLESAAGKALQAAHAEGRDHRCVGLRIHGGCGRSGHHRDLAQVLAQSRFDLVEEQVHALLQALVFVHQRVAHHDACHAGVLLTKLQQQGHELARTRHGIGLSFTQLVDQTEHRLLDELDQALKHLRLAGEVAVERGLAHIQSCRQRGRGDALGTRLLQHGGQRVQDLHPTLARLGTLATIALNASSNIGRDIGRQVGHGQWGAGSHGRSVRRLSAGGRWRGPVFVIPCFIFSQPSRRPPGCPSRIQWERIMVPNGWLPSTSSSSACGTRPSMMCTALTPLLAESSAPAILGIMPPLIVPSSTSSSMRRGVSSVKSLPSLSSTPGMLVSISSFSAFSTLGSTLTMSPTWPTSCSTFGSFWSDRRSFCARIMAPSRPVRPTALPPAALIRPTMSCCTSPPSTHSTTSMVSASVTRMPWMNCPFLPRRCSSVSICGPPPCTTTGLMPTNLSSTTSSAKSCCRAGSVMALPPYLMTMVLPWYLRM